MKKIFLIIALTLPNVVFAVSDQIYNAEQYLQSESFSIFGDKYLQDGEENTAINAIAPKNEIKFGQSNPILIKYQNQNFLTPTGKFDDETLAFVQSKQKELGLNVTKTIDYNTWFATYKQSQIWQENTILQSSEEWEKILAKQYFNETNKFIVVNIPTMTLHTYEYDVYTQEAKEIFVSKVVIGKRTNQTPLDDMYLWGLKYHPNWTPTPNMLKRNLYNNGSPNIKWLSSHNIKVINPQGEVIPYSQITRNQNLRFVQPSGDNNALGILKFETTSEENIYLHDTNEKRLFGHNTRSHSSGCVRVQDFQILGQWVANINSTALTNKFKNQNMRIERIEQPVPVYFSYSQVMFVNSEPIFAPDIYGKNNNTTFE